MSSDSETPAMELGRIREELDHERRLVRLYKRIAHQLEDRHDLRRKTLEMPWGEAFVRFIHEVEKRLHRGHKEYGDRSWSKTDAEIDREIDEEFFDVAGWTFLRIARKWLRQEGDNGQAQH